MSYDTWPCFKTSRMGYLFLAYASKLTSTLLASHLFRASTSRLTNALLAVGLLHGFHLGLLTFTGIATFAATTAPSSCRETTANHERKRHYEYQQYNFFHFLFPFLID